jgi:GNAT superfamily N-acetyltransferase
VPEIVSLSRNHDRSGFDCGIPELNLFLKATALQHSEKGISRTFVLTEQESPATILGYFTLTLCEVRMDHRHPLPAARLARLAVSKKYRGKGFGSLLLTEAIHRTVLIADQAGLIGLFVDAKNEQAHLFYEHFGFVSLPDHALQLFLPIETLNK